MLAYFRLSLGNTLGAMIIAYLFLHFFWFFGINGSSVVGAVFNPVLRALSVENLQKSTITIINDSVEPPPPNVANMS
jgi:cellobiose-specific phosphotransferase system component IIC